MLQAAAAAVVVELPLFARWGNGRGVAILHQLVVVVVLAAAKSTVFERWLVYSSQTRYLDQLDPLLLLLLVSAIEGCRVLGD